MLNQLKRLTVTTPRNLLRIYDLFKLTPREYFIDEKMYNMIKNNPNIYESDYKVKDYSYNDYSYDVSNLDLSKLEKQLNDALNKETKQTLKAWLDRTRKENKIRELEEQILNININNNPANMNNTTTKNTTWKTNTTWKGTWTWNETSTNTNTGE